MKEECNHLFNSLNVSIDKDDLIKIKGRLQNVALNLPILLNKDSYVMHLIIWNYHIRRLHSGVKILSIIYVNDFGYPEDRKRYGKTLKIVSNV